jgi:hypothetical protein
MSWKAIGWGVAVVLVWMTASVGPCRALDGNELLHTCADGLRGIDQASRSINAQQVMSAGWCTGYILGVQDGYVRRLIDTHTGVAELVAFGICHPPEGVAHEQSLRIVVKHLREHPQHLHLSGELLVIEAMRAAFPCPAPATPPQELAPADVRPTPIAQAPQGPLEGQSDYPGDQPSFPAS